MAGANPIVLALVVALATGLPALVYTIWRGRKIGPREEEALVTKTAQQGVEMMSTVLDAAREDRERMERRIEADAKRIVALEGEQKGDHEKIVALEGRVEELETEVEHLKAA